MAHTPGTVYPSLLPSCQTLVFIQQIMLMKMEHPVCVSDMDYFFFQYKGTVIL